MFCSLTKPIKAGLLSGAGLILLWVNVCSSQTLNNPSYPAKNKNKNAPRWVVIKHETIVVTPQREQNGDSFLSADNEGPVLKKVPQSAETVLVETEDPGTADPFSEDTVEDDPFGDDFKEDEEVFEEDPFEKEEVDIPHMSDPWEGFNRSMYWFNDNLYVYLMRPVGQTYRDIVWEDFRIVIRNLFDHVTAPQKLVSSLLQWEWGKSGRVVSRAVINTLFGWGGMLDVAGQEYGIENVNEDIGQALGSYGIGSGPYLVLPFLGPSSVRHTVGRVADGFLNPIFYLDLAFIENAGITAGNMVNEVSFRIDDIDTLRRDAIDPYESMRDFYHQFRELDIQK